MFRELQDEDKRASGNILKGRGNSGLQALRDHFSAGESEVSLGFLLRRNMFIMSTCLTSILFGQLFNLLL